MVGENLKVKILLTCQLNVAFCGIGLFHKIIYAFPSMGVQSRACNISFLNF